MEVIKQLRHRQIRDIVERQPIRTQHELAAALRERGFRVTQATVSRDIAEIGLVKANHDGGTVYELPTGTADAEASPEQKLRDLIAGLPLDIREAACCWSSAPCPARLTRSPLRWIVSLAGVVGSLAGDDTLFVAFSDAPRLRRISDKDRGARHGIAHRRL
jgi:transcriptional regulator of arginine metabolism